jgi:hypothetical protein
VVGGSNQDEVTGGTSDTPSCYRTVSTCLTAGRYTQRACRHCRFVLVGQKVSGK